MRPVLSAALSMALVVLATVPGAGAEQVNLLSLQQGSFPVVEPESYGGWPVEAILDDSPTSGWACVEGQVANAVFVIEMVAEATIERFEFDTAGIDTEGAGAKDVVVEVSATSQDTGYAEVLRATLAAAADGQAFPASSRAPGRWVRLTIRNNHGSEAWTELLGFRGLGTRPALAAPVGVVSGTYATDYSDFHVRQQGSALVGCYEYDDGLLDGTIEGRVMKITWREGEDHSQAGPAVMVFSPEGRSFRGYWWNAGSEKGPPSGRWDGVKSTTEVGSCPHWSGSVSGELSRELEATGRARVYGILFDLDSATLRPESMPVLDEIARSLAAQPGWQLTVEGHTDGTGAADHNQTLSEQRAAAVKSYLVAAGIEASRLETVGFGQSRPVADNATELGRSQNRRVEIVRR